MPNEALDVRISRIERRLMLASVILGLAFIATNVDYSAMMLHPLFLLELGLLALLLFFVFRSIRQYKYAYCREIQKASSTDALSRLFTAQQYFETLEGEIERSARYHRNLCTIRIDIDYFRRYNTSFGVLSGDEVLAFLGELIRNATRKYDTGYRLGDDEFGLIHPETDGSQARVVAERIRKNFKAKYEGRLSLSMGIAQWEKDDSVDRLIRKADAAMEQAREAGGDRLRVYIERGML